MGLISSLHFLPACCHTSNCRDVYLNKIVLPEFTL